MAYAPNHDYDVFVSFCHDDPFAWTERFKLDLESLLRWKLRARRKPAVFLDVHDLRAGRVFDKDIPTFLNRTAYFVALVSPRYHTSNYCKFIELPAFLEGHAEDQDRVIQVRLDPEGGSAVERRLER